MDETDRPNGTEAMVEATAGEASPPAAEPENTGAAFAKKAKDLEALRAAVIDAASVGAGLWLSYLFVLLYLAIAVGSVTHRNLLFESPVKLPFLNVDLPLLGFFVLGPVIFLIVHAYVLLHFVLLADKVGAFHAELQAQIADEDARTRLRRQLPSNIFVQFLAGPREVRTGVMGFLLRLIAQISLVAGPLALLVFFQLQFLPYHNEAIAWWQRVAVVIDLALLWTLWPSVARGETTHLGWRDFQRGSVVACALASLVPILLVFSIATFPGEWLDATLPPVRFVPTKWPMRDWISLHELLVQGEVDFVGGKPASLWSNRLVLPGIDLTGSGSSGAEAGSAAVGEPLSLRGRRLEGAVLIGARLRKVDFTAVQLQGADLSRADLREAKFECAESKHSQRMCPQLQGTMLIGANLQGVSLGEANLQGASLESAHLQGATFELAQLRAARLDRAELQGASLVGSPLEGASLRGANLQGASLDRAHLQGALFWEAQLQAATFERAQLQGATFTASDPHGAAVVSPKFDGAILDNVYVWRAEIRHTLDTPYVVAPTTTGYLGRGCPVGRSGQPMRCAWSARMFADLKRAIEEQVPKGVEQDRALEQIAILDPATPLAEENQMAKAWNDLAGAWKDVAGSAPALAVHEKILADVLQSAGCNADGPPHVIRGLLRNFYYNRFQPESTQPAALAAIFLDETHCAGAHGLSEADKVKLQEIRDRRSPIPPGAVHSPSKQ